MDTTNLVQSNISKQIPFSSYSIDFDGLLDYINCGNAFTQTGAFTVSAWINTTSSPANSVLYKDGVFQFGKDNWYNGGAAGAPHISITDSGGITKNMRGDLVVSGVTRTDGTVIDLKDGNWHHIAFTYDGVSQGKYYSDGIMSYTYDITDASWAGTLASNSNDLLIGKAATVNWDGNISNTTIWNSTLNQDDVLNLYNNGVPQDLNNFRITPVAWYPMDQSYTYFNGSVLVARDVISGNDGTGANVIQENIVGNAPGSTANGTGTNLDLSDLIGDMKNSTNNSYSINMADYADGVTNPANSGRSTLVP
jgi:hypothetical protein